MSALIPLPVRSVMIWLAAYFSPSAYFLLLLLINAAQVPTPPAILVVTLFCLIPLGALVVCASVVWRSGMIGGRRIGWMLFTLFAWALQVGILLIIILEAVTAAISYAQHSSRMPEGVAVGCHQTLVLQHDRLGRVGVTGTDRWVS